MASVNKWIGIGNLGRDPELRPFDQRAGAMQAFALPSVINGRVVARGGRS